jgi:hypothetical protein
MSSLIRRLVSLLWLGLVLPGVGAAEDEINPVMKYYWDHARSAAASFNPNVSGVTYRFKAKTYRHSVASDGIIRKTDSLEQIYYYHDGIPDSVTTVRGKVGRFKRLDLTFPNVFENRYDLNFYPNDVGGPRLAIGMISDTLLPKQPDGLVVIDRNRYFPYSLYLYYPQKDGYQRYARAFRFAVVDDLVFPDSVWEVSTRLGVFFTESYRFETGISDIEVVRTDSLK